MPTIRLDGKFMNYKRHFRVVSLSLAVIAGNAFAADDAAQSYAKFLADAESIAAHNNFVERQLSTQGSQAATIERELAEMDKTAAEVGPLLVRMHAEIKNFVANDLPFTDPEASREKRMARLDSLMADSSVSMAERYRRLLEAYQIEMEYGRTMETYKGKLDDGRDVDFIRVGRITLLYITTDGLEAGYWNKTDKQWVADNDYKSAIAKALRIANKGLAPDLIEVPVPAPQEVRS